MTEKDRERIAKKILEFTRFIAELKSRREAEYKLKKNPLIDKSEIYGTNKNGMVISFNDY